MTEVINGSQKVIISQLVRSPGSYFKTEINNKTGENLYNRGYYSSHWRLD